MAEKTLNALVDLHDLDKVWGEVAHLNRLMSPALDLAPIETAFDDLRRLFAGRYPGWRACNTEYHDLNHTTDTLAAMTRLMHGACVSGTRFSDRELILAAVSAMFHDAGYIQTEGDTKGTGAQYTACHIERSIAFLDRYFPAHGFPKDYPGLSAALLRCTGLNTDIKSLHFSSENFELMGKMLGAGDLLGQMADRNYLEKLLFLFYEFKEGKVSGFKDEFDLLQKTLSFHAVTQKRMVQELGGVARFMRAHFKSRWGVDRDLYAAAIEQHIAHLQLVVKKGRPGYRQLLRRGGLLEKLDKIYGRG